MSDLLPQPALESALRSSALYARWLRDDEESWRSPRSEHGGPRASHNTAHLSGFHLCVKIGVVEPSTRLLILEDDLYLGASLQRLLSSHFQTHWVTSVASARGALACHLFDAILSDFQLGEETAEDFLRVLATSQPNLRRVVYSSASRMSLASTEQFVHRVLTKPSPFEKILAALL